MAQEKDDFKRLSEKYENELMNYYRAHAPTVLSYSGNTRSIEPSEFERDRVSEHRIGNEANVSGLSENEAAAGEQREEIVHLEEENIPPENSPLADEPTLPMSPLPNIEDIPPSENRSGNNMRSRGSASTQTERDDRPPQAQGTGTGFIKVAVSTAQQAVPLPGCKVTISSGENGIDFYAEYETDISGNTPVVSVPAPSRDLSQTPGGNVRPYYRYNIDVEFPCYDEVNITEVPVFEGILSIQPVSLAPAAGGGKTTTDTPGFPL